MSKEISLTKGNKTLTFKIPQPKPKFKVNRKPLASVVLPRGESDKQRDNIVASSSLITDESDSIRTRDIRSNKDGIVGIGENNTQKSSNDAKARAVQPKIIKGQNKKNITVSFTNESAESFRQRLFAARKSLAEETAKIVPQQGNTPTTTVSIEAAVASRAPPVVDNKPKLPAEIPASTLFSPAFIAAAMQPSVQADVEKMEKREEATQKVRNRDFSTATSDLGTTRNTPKITARGTLDVTGTMGSTAALNQINGSTLSGTRTRKLRRGPLNSFGVTATRGMATPRLATIDEDAGDDEKAVAQAKIAAEAEANEQSAASGAGNPHSIQARLQEMLVSKASRPRPIVALAEPLYCDYADFFASTGTPLQAPQRIDPHGNKGANGKNGGISGSQRGGQNGEDRGRRRSTDEEDEDIRKGNVDSSTQYAQRLMGARPSQSGGDYSTHSSSGSSSSSTSSSQAGSSRGTIKDYEFLVETTRRLGESRSEASSLFGLGILYDNNAQYKKSIPCYERLCQLSRRLCDPVGEALALNALGNAYFYQATHESYLMSLDCHERHSNLVASNTTSSSSSSSSSDPTQQSTSSSAQGSTQLFKTKDRYIALSNLGLVYAALGEYETASHYLQLSLGLLTTDSPVMTMSTQGADGGIEDEAMRIFQSDGTQVPTRQVSIEEELHSVGLLTQIEMYLVKVREDERRNQVQTRSMFTLPSEEEEKQANKEIISPILEPTLRRQCTLSTALKGTQFAANVSMTFQMLGQLENIKGEYMEAEKDFGIARAICKEHGDTRGANAAKIGMGIARGTEKFKQLLRSYQTEWIAQHTEMQEQEEEEDEEEIEEEEQLDEEEGDIRERDGDYPPIRSQQHRMDQNAEEYTPTSEGEAEGEGEDMSEGEAEGEGESMSEGEAEGEGEGEGFEEL